MTIEEFVEMCKKQDWPALINFLSSNIKDLSYKILVSSYIGTYHPEADKAKKYGLSDWDTKLSADLVGPTLSLFTSAVDLADFTNAFILATHAKTLNDAKVGDAIVTYVKANKMRFGPAFFESKQVEDELKETAKKAFGDFNFSKSDREAYFKKKFMKQALDKITYLQAIDEVKEQLERVLNIRPNLFRVSFSEPASLRGITMFSTSDEGGISFNEKISSETIKQFSQTLKEIGVDANFYDYYRGRGIQIFEKPEVFAKKLAEGKKLEDGRKLQESAPKPLAVSSETKPSDDQETLSKKLSM